MNPEDKPNVARMRSIFDSDDSEDESGSITDNINAILKATSPGPLEKSLGSTSDTDNFSNDETKVLITESTTKFSSKVWNIEYSHTLTSDQHQQNAQESDSSNGSVHNEPQMITKLNELSYSEEANSSPLSESGVKNGKTVLPGNISLHEQVQVPSLSCEEYKLESSSILSEKNDTLDSENISNICEKDNSHLSENLSEIGEKFEMSIVQKELIDVDTNVPSLDKNSSNIETYFDRASSNDKNLESQYSLKVSPFGSNDKGNLDKVSGIEQLNVEKTLYDLPDNSDNKLMTAPINSSIHIIGEQKDVDMQELSSTAPEQDDMQIMKENVPNLYKHSLKHNLDMSVDNEIPNLQSECIIKDEFTSVDEDELDDSENETPAKDELDNSENAAPDIDELYNSESVAPDIDELDNSENAAPDIDELNNSENAAPDIDELDNSENAAHDLDEKVSETSISKDTVGNVIEMEQNSTVVISIHSSSDEDDLVIDETISSKDQNVLGFKSGNFGKKKILVENIFTDSDNSDHHELPKYKTSMSKKMLPKKCHPDGTIILTKLDAINMEKTRLLPSKQKQGAKRKPRQQTHNLSELVSVFEKGWRREVVYSNTNSARADIYYFSPTGHKLRSKVEIENYLRTEGIWDIELSSFTFAKEPLGVEAKYETVRYATMRTNNADYQNGNSPIQSVTASERMMGPFTSKKRKQNLIKSIARFSVKASTSQQRKIAPKPSEKDVANSLGKVVLSSKDTRPLNCNKSALHSFRKSQNCSTYIPQNTLTYTTSPLTSSDLSNVQQHSILTPLVVGENTEKTYHCTANCQKAVGRVPNLQCVNCLCLFHHECCFMPENTVNLIFASHAKFLCPNCYSTKSEKEYKMSFKIPLHKDPFSFLISDEEDEGVGIDIADTLPCGQIQMKPVTPAHLQIIQKTSGQYIMLQGTTAASDVGNIAHSQQEGSYAIAGQPAVMNTFIPAQIIPALNLHQSLIDDKVPVLEQLPTIQKDPPPPPKKDLFADVNSGYAILKNIFSYLDLPDLLVMAQVCTMWKDLAYNPNFWSTVRLRNVCIKDWPKMIIFLKQRRTRHLDMRKMVFKPLHIFPTVPKIDKQIDAENGSTEMKEKFINDNNVEVSKEDALSHSDTNLEHLEQVPPPHNSDTVILDATKDGTAEKNAKHIFEMRQNDDECQVTENMHTDCSNINNSTQEDRCNNTTEMEIISETEKPITAPIMETKLEDMPIASTSGIEIVAGIKRKLDDADVDISQKRRQIEYEEMGNILSEHDYYVASNGLVHGHCVDIREEVVCSNGESLLSSLEPICEVPDERSIQGQRGISPSLNQCVIQPSKTFCDKQTQFGTQLFQQPKPTDKGDYIQWHHIFEEISMLDCLEQITLGNVDSIHLEILLFYCRKLLSLCVSNISSRSNDLPCFDPSYLMPVNMLRELRFVCSKSYTFKSNFNFIKLPELRILMLKGLRLEESGWPYLGTKLTHLHLSPIDNFTKNNWENLSNMTELSHLELESCSDDTPLCAMLPRMTNIKSIGLYDWHVGQKLGAILKRLHNIESLFIIPAKENMDDSKGLYAGRVLALVQSMRNLKEFEWGVQPSVFAEAQDGKIFLRDLKEDQTPRAISVESLEGFIKQRKPNTRVQVKCAFVSKLRNAGSNSMLNLRSV